MGEEISDETFFELAQANLQFSAIDDASLDEQIDELALDIERKIQKWDEELEQMRDYPDRTDHRGVIAVESLT